VVTGANAAASRESLPGLDVNVAENHDWQSGMSSPVRVGVAAIASDPKIEAVVLMLCDQPFVTEDVILELVRAYREKKCSIVASRYAESYGVPALFDRMHFAELMALEGKAGAKRVIEIHLRNVHLLSFPEGKIDIDTPEDFARLQSKSPGS
jgi:molybdenum cofactor cytidylyltransferase